MFKVMAGGGGRVRGVSHVQVDGRDGGRQPCSRRWEGGGGFSR